MSVRRRYDLFDEDDVTSDLDQLQKASAWKQDQRLKNDITSVLHRLELDNVKPGYDVLTQTGFRRGYQVRNRSPGDTLSASPQPLVSDRGRMPSRRHSYIEPRVFHHQLEKHAPIHVERSVRFIEPEPIHRIPEPASSSVWYYTEPRSYSFLQSTAPSSLRRSVVRPEENRALTEYSDTLAAAPTSHHHHQQRWSVYGSAPVAEWKRSNSTPPDFQRMSTVRPVGDRLTRRRNHEFTIGVKLAESQRELDTFNRMLDKRFGDADRGNPWRSTRSYSAYPSYWPTAYYTSPLYYDYKTPRITTYYGSDLHRPYTRVSKPSEILEHSDPYGYLDYVPYSTTYSKYVPYSYLGYGRTSLSGYEPWHSSYPRSSYSVDRSRYLY